MPETEMAICVGCGCRLPASNGPVHAYMVSSPACWAAFGEVIAREFQTPTLMPLHRLTVDAWAVQHTGDGSRRGVQSVGLHLARLSIQLETGLEGDAANARMLAFAARKAEIPNPGAAWGLDADRRRRDRGSRARSAWDGRPGLGRSGLDGHGPSPRIYPSLGRPWLRLLNPIGRNRIGGRATPRAADEPTHDTPV